MDSIENIKLFWDFDLPDYLYSLSSNECYWIVKRLTGNDTGATEGKQVGPYLPKHFFSDVFLDFFKQSGDIKDNFFSSVYILNFDYLVKNIRAVFYTSKNEGRLTRWGGKLSPLSDHDNTGAIFVFGCKQTTEGMLGISWISTSIEEELTIENWIGTEVLSGAFYSSLGNFSSDTLDSGILFKPEELPQDWLFEFPTGINIFNFVEKTIPSNSYTNEMDTLITKRRSLEFEIFKYLENHFTLPLISKGFNNVEDFMNVSNSVSNRRKSRAGKSLEYNLASVLSLNNIDFDAQAITEGRSKPDFLFPSKEAYHKKSFPEESLFMLASKTSVKERWNQILNEAQRIQVKHLFTLQEGVSSNQLQKMYNSKVQLVIPKKNRNSFPKEWRDQLMDIESFINLIAESQKKLQHSSYKLDFN